MTDPLGSLHDTRIRHPWKGGGAVNRKRTYDAIIIGAGQAGGPLAGALAAAGRRVALVERSHVGGTCVNEGCTPTKTMIASARASYAAVQATALGIHVGPVSVDMKAVRDRKRRMVKSFREGSLRRVEEADGIDLIRGTGRFLDRRRVEVVAERMRNLQLTGTSIFINTGLRPRIPNLDGLESVPFLDSTSIMELDEVPEHLLILGGGYVGVEFAQLFRRLGSRVTLIHRSRQILRHEDADVASEVMSILGDDGIDILLDTSPRRVNGAPAGRVELSVDGPDGKQTLRGSHLLVAVGRVPNTEALDLAAAGIETDRRGYIRTNDRLETTVEGIYALGDVKGGPAFTHIAYDDYRIVRANLLDGKGASITNRLVPYTVYMDPQLGGIGLTEREAEEAGRPIRVAKIPMTSVARALEIGEPRGLIKALVDPQTDRILGAAVLGIEGGELMAVLQTAMIGDIRHTALRDGVFAHPSIAESLNTLFSTL